MGEGTVGLSASSNGGPETSARTAARRLDDEIGMLRAELTTLVSELDRRRHEALDVRLQIKRRAPGLAIAAVALVVAASGFVWWRARQARQMATLGARANDLRHRLSRMIHPPAPAREPNAVGRILTTAATAAAATAMRRGLDWGLRSALEYRRIEEERRSKLADASGARSVTRWPASTAGRRAVAPRANGRRAWDQVGEPAPESVVSSGPFGSPGASTQ